MLNKIIKLNSPKETDLFARLIAKYLFPGSIILLWGEMGSGKTTFTKSLCSRLGVPSKNVTSPTYTLVNIYQGNLPIFHVDLFRLSSLNEMEDFDRHDLMSEEGITIVEWPKLFLSFLSYEPFINVRFETLSINGRKLFLESSSVDFKTLFVDLKKNYL